MSLKLSELEDVKPEGSGNSFYVTFADLMMLLCVFFVLLLAMSKVETGLFERVKMGITGTAKGTLVELAANLKAIANGNPGVPGVKSRPLPYYPLLHTFSWSLLLHTGLLILLLSRKPLLHTPVLGKYPPYPLPKIWLTVQTLPASLAVTEGILTFPYPPLLLHTP